MMNLENWSTKSRVSQGSSFKTRLPTITPQTVSWLITWNLRISTRYSTRRPWAPVSRQQRREWRQWPSWYSSPGLGTFEIAWCTLQTNMALEKAPFRDGVPIQNLHLQRIFNCHAFNIAMENGPLWPIYRWFKYYTWWVSTYSYV